MEILSTKKAKDKALNSFFHDNTDHTSFLLTSCLARYNLLNDAIIQHKCHHFIHKNILFDEIKIIHIFGNL